jgi:hypothetical protein
LVKSLNRLIIEILVGDGESIIDVRYSAEEPVEAWSTVPHKYK